ncbi:MAG: ABC transporter ATP-binding protein [Bacteroidota bacterium]
MSVSGKAFDKNLLYRILYFVKPYRKLFIGSIVLTLLLAGLSPLRPIITEYILDHCLDTAHQQTLLNLTILMVGILLAQSVVQFSHAWTTNLLGQCVIKDLRKELFDKMIHFRLPYFDKTPVGTAITRSVSDMETIADIFSEGLIIIIGDLLQLIVIIGVMLYTDWQLTLICLTTIPLLLIATTIFKNKIKATFGDVRTQVAALNSFVQEHLTGMRVVQLFNREEKEMEKFQLINAQHRDANIKSVWYYSIFFPVVEILSAISIALLVWWGSGQVISSNISFGMLVSFIMYINMLFRPIRELADKFNTLQMGMVSAERIFKLLDEKETTRNEGHVLKEKMEGTIEFKDVWFAYNDQDRNNHEPDWILKGLSFKVNAGECVAFVGATGAGKSTIISILNRFYEISKGEILIDGINIYEYDLEFLRKKVAVVLQDVFLFSDTIANNISLFNNAISEEEISNAVAAIGSEQFIKELPGELNYRVMERGQALSMGQRQLIAFVRAYVYQPDILILDEATSSVDSTTEELITKATDVITKGRTSIIIAHRLSTIQDADKIFVLEKGRIVESGTHYELLQNNLHYKALFEIQFMQQKH